MKLLILLFIVLVGCSSTSSSLSPIQAVGCTVESTIVGVEAQAIATLLTCSNVAQIQTDMQTALGNVNFCAVPVPAPAVTSLIATKVKTIGDITQADLDAAKKGVQSKAVAKGIVATIACPIFFNVALGFATSQIPSKWSCQASTSAASLGAALTAACETAITL